MAIRDDFIFWLGFERRRVKINVAYEHGLNADGGLVHIADAERGGRYFCAGCGERLVAVLGDKRPRRFRHCAAEDSANCSTEHAIRRIAKMSVTYEHGLNADGELVHIADAERGGQYFCAGCGKRLVEVLGDERPLSFRHRSAADGDACEPEHAIFRMSKLAIVAGWRAAKANGWEYPIVMPRESCQTDARVLDATDFDHADEVNPDGRVREPCRKTADLLGRVDIRPKGTIVAPPFRLAPRHSRESGNPDGFSKASHTKSSMNCSRRVDGLAGVGLRSGSAGVPPAKPR